MSRIHAKTFRRLDKRALGWALGALGAIVPGRAHAFQLVEPAPWIVEGRDGDPQTVGPCGADVSVCSQPTGAVTTFTAGQEISINWVETVPSDGWFRVALSYHNRTDLSDPVVVTDNAGVVIDAAIALPADPDAAPLGITTYSLPVLADGLFPHLAADLPGVPYRYTWNVVLPNRACDKCTLQITQFLGKKTSGGYFAHHCADITILPVVDVDAATNPHGTVSAPDDAGGPTPACATAEAGLSGSAHDGGSTSVADAGAFTAQPDVDAAGGAQGGGADAGSPGAAGGDAGATANAAMTSGNGSGGCGCGVAAEGAPAALLGLGGFLALAAVGRRKRRLAR